MDSRTGVLTTWGPKNPAPYGAHHETKTYVMVRGLKLQLKVPISSSYDTAFRNLSHYTVQHALKCAICSMLYKLRTCITGYKRTLLVVVKISPQMRDVDGLS